MDIPGLARTAILNFLVTPNLPRDIPVLVGIRALKTLGLLPKNWPENLNVRGIGVEEDMTMPIGGGSQEPSGEQTNYVKTKQANIPKARVMPQITGPVQPSGDPLYDWYWFKESSTCNIT
jgi:hypothetical protein